MQPQYIAEGVPVTSVVNADRAPTTHEQDSLDCFLIKRAFWNCSTAKYLLQSSNGPCPLLAICNTLSLRGIVEFPGDRSVSIDALKQMVAHILLKKGDSNENVRAILDDSIGILQKLNRGMDVNIRFTSVDSFDHTKETAVFDALDIRLFHAWIVSEEDVGVYPYIVPLTYNDAIEKVAFYEEMQSKALASGDFEIATADRNLFSEGETLAKWLHSTSGQVTSDGIIGVNSHMKEGDLAVFFRNNHFSVIHKREGRLYGLVTDEGYAKTSVMWESIDQLDGDTLYLDATFTRVSGETPAESDYEMAMRLQYGSTSNPGIIPAQAVVVSSPPPRVRRKDNKCACSIM
jgi:hypothetical protein